MIFHIYTSSKNPVWDLLSIFSLKYLFENIQWHGKVEFIYVLNYEIYSITVTYVKQQLVQIRASFYGE